MPPSRAIIRGVGTLQKSGNGNLCLTGTNSYDGGTVVRAGTLLVTDGGSIHHADSDLLVAQHAFDVANLTIQNGGNVTVGNLDVGTHYKSSGTVVVDGNTSLLTLSNT